LLCAQPYSGPHPPKPDIPYLVHADTLVPTEVTEAKETASKNEAIYVIPGASSPAKTPMAEPIFLYQASEVAPERLQLYKLEVRNGNREVAMSSKKHRAGARPLRLSITRLAEHLFRVEAAESLENGEYSFSPADSNQVFCFEVY
jgi:hypothetical protein